MAKREKTAIVGLTLRLREDLRLRLENSAEKEGRSLNNEVIQRIEESFRRETADKVLEQTIHVLQEMKLERENWETFRPIFEMSKAEREKMFKANMAKREKKK